MPKPREGDWFAVPLASSLYVLGLVARAPKRGQTLFGYFFGPLQTQIPQPESLVVYRPSDALRACRFRDDALRSARWPIIASVSDWDRTAWPMPDFHVPFTHEVTGESWAVTYSEDNPDRSIRRRRISFEEEADYPQDGVFPPSHLEYELARMLGVRGVEEETEVIAVVEEGVRHFLLIPSDAVERVRWELHALGFDEVAVIDERDDTADVEAFQRGSLADLRSSVDETEERLTALAREVGGDYEGLEWALGDTRGG
jgi:immunity protein 26 of polymorphic toxin system